MFAHAVRCAGFLSLRRQISDRSSVQLLDKTRKIGRLLHNNNSSKVVFNDICSVMRDILDYTHDKIGKYFGGRKHSTVINSINNIDENPDLKKTAEDIKKRINE